MHATEMADNMNEEFCKKHNFNVSAAAKELGLGRTTMYRKMTKYGF